MCGILAYTGQGIATEIIIEGLKRLEYRGEIKVSPILRALPRDKIVFEFTRSDLSCTMQNPN